MCSTDLEAVSRMSLGNDLLEKGKLSGECILDQVAGDGIEGCHEHVSIGVEVVHKLDLVDVLEDKVTHGTSLRLREGERSGKILSTRVFLSPKVAMGETVVTIQVNTSVSVISTEPLSTPGVVEVLSLHHMVRCLEEGLLNIEYTIHI